MLFVDGQELYYSQTKDDWILHRKLGFQDNKIQVSERCKLWLIYRFRLIIMGRTSWLSV